MGLIVIFKKKYPVHHTLLLGEMDSFTRLMFVITPARIYNPQEGELLVATRFQANHEMMVMLGLPGSS